MAEPGTLWIEGSDGVRRRMEELDERLLTLKNSVHALRSAKSAADEDALTETVIEAAESLSSLVSGLNLKRAGSSAATQRTGTPANRAILTGFVRG